MRDVNQAYKKGVERRQLEALINCWEEIGKFIDGSGEGGSKLELAVRLVTHFCPPLSPETWLEGGRRNHIDHELIDAVVGGGVSVEAGFGAIERIELMRARQEYAGLKRTIDEHQGLIDVTPNDEIGDFFNG